MLKKIISFVLSFTLIASQPVFAQGVAQINLGNYLRTVGSSMAMDKFRPLHMRYFSYDMATDNFQLLLDKGDNKDIKEGELEEKTKVLMDYFKIGLSLPNEKFWVNLRPDAQEQIIDPELEKTDIGKIMLEADLQLKKDTAGMTSPQTPEGKAYWDKLYKKAGELFGTENITIPTITRPWIVPGEIILRQGEDSAYIFKANMKVMLESDYLNSRQSPVSGLGSSVSGLRSEDIKDPRMKELNEYSSQLIRELIIPKLTKEVNIAKRYAPLRQVFFSLVMARWFKDTFTGKPGQYAQLIDSHNLDNLMSKEFWSKTYYFNEYKKSFEKGEYNLKEEVFTPTGQAIRSYVSGGIVTSSPAVMKISGYNPMVAGSSLSISRSLRKELKLATLEVIKVLEGITKKPENLVNHDESEYSTEVNDLIRKIQADQEDRMKQPFSWWEFITKDYVRSPADSLYNWDHYNFAIRDKKAEYVKNLRKVILSEIEARIASSSITGEQYIRSLLDGKYGDIIVGQVGDKNKANELGIELFNELKDKGDGYKPLGVTFTKAELLGFDYINVRMFAQVLMLRDRGVVQRPKQTTLDNVSLALLQEEVLKYFNVGNSGEIRTKAPQFIDMAVAYAGVTTNEFFNSPAGEGLSANQRTAAKNMLVLVAHKVARHFKPTGYHVDINDQKLVLAARAQHIGYVAGVLNRELNLSEERVREALNKYYDQAGDINIIRDNLKLSDEYLKNNGWMFDGGFDGNGQWGFWSFGAANVALNLPGVYAGEAVLNFANTLTDGKGKELLTRLLSYSKDIENLLQGKGDPQEAALAAFSARAAQLGWLVSKLGQGIVEAHNPKKEQGSVKKWAPVNGLITTFNIMAEKKGWTEVAKDIDQIKSYVRHVTTSSSVEIISTENKQKINLGLPGYDLLIEDLGGGQVNVGIKIPELHVNKIIPASDEIYQKFIKRLVYDLGYINKNGGDESEYGMAKPTIKSSMKEFAEYLSKEYKKESQVSSSVMPGGIDFRQMNYLVQPMGNFKDLQFGLPTLSSSALEKINLELELEKLRDMVKNGFVPSGTRVKEYLAACFQKGKIEEKQDDLLVCLAEIYRLAEEENLETSPELRESLVIVDTGKFVLLPNNQKAGLN